jgi:phosphohistidine swiveling domain-containing protein
MVSGRQLLINTFSRRNKPVSASIEVADNDHEQQAACPGGKAARLRQLQAAGFNIPDFVVSPRDVNAAVRQLGTPIAVRSSASVEDGPNVSFAGQFESYLNLNSLSDIQRCIQDCHASVHAPSVANYCRRQGVDAGQIRMDVILQRMVNPDLAGVAFTVNPATGEEQIVIEATAGLADELLAGHEPPLPADHPLLQQHSAAIADVARRIQRFFGAPQDIEFAIEQDTLFILQARPITRIAFTAEIGEWTNADFRDGGVSSTVCTPLMWSLYEFVWDRALKSSLRELRLYRGDFCSGRMFFGRPYWNLGAVKECLATLPGFVERDFDQDLSVQINYEGPGRRTPLSATNVIRAVPTLLSVGSFFRRQQKIAENLLRTGVSSSVAESALQSSPISVEGFQKLVERDYLNIERIYFQTIFAASLAKLDFLSSFPDANYGALVAALPPLRHMAPVRAVQELPRRGDTELREIIENHRHHCRLGLDVKHPRWDEDLEFVTHMLAELPESGGEDPRPCYEDSRSRMLSQLPRRKHNRFNRKLDRLRHFVWLREELRDVSSRMYYLIRRSVLRIADAHGVGDDIFFCRFQDIARSDWSHADRGREIYESYRNFTAPNEIGVGYQLQPQTEVTGLTGIPASGGRVTGTAFVARDVAEAAAMPTGQILICLFTDPGWTPVLDRAGGVVTETGGLLSHAAIICREYGIPAVLGIRDATSRIRHGSTITLHGNEGRVEHSAPFGPESQ